MLKICVHQYLTNCKTNIQPPGFADFLRGTQTLYLLSKRYNYKLLIDFDIHPIFKFLKYNENFYIKNLNVDTLEVIPPINYNNIYNILKLNFESNNDIYILTNSFHSDHMITDHYDQNQINESNNYLKEILLPNNLLSILIKKRLLSMNINDNYIVIHLRFNDNCFNDNFILSSNHKNKLYNVINNIQNDNSETKIIVLSNYYDFIEELKQKYDNLFFNKNNPIHLGSLDKNINIDDLDEISDIEDDEKDKIEFKLLNKLDKKIRDTLIDLFILTKASKIYGISQYMGSGFSYQISEIYNIPYYNLSNNVF